MVEITILQVELPDAQFNAPFSRSREGGPEGGLKSVVSEVTRSAGSESGEDVSDLDADESGTDSPGRGAALVGAFFAFVVVAWVLRRSRRGSSVEERPIEAA